MESVAQFKMTTSARKTIPGGLLIAFEGIDGSGKTTMARRTAAALKAEGYQAQYLCEPTDGPYGRQLRALFTAPGPRDVQREFELFLKDRREDVAKNIQPLLDAGGIVCIDRYYISSMVYQGALGLSMDEIRKANEEFAPVPHAILHFSLPVDVALERIRASRSEGANNFEEENNLRTVAGLFDQLDFPQLITIDAVAAEEAVFQQIRAALTPLVKELA